MTGERYKVRPTSEGFYVYDTQDEILVGAPHDIRISAELEAMRMNRRDRLQENLLDGLRNELRTLVEQEASVYQSSHERYVRLGECMGDVARSLGADSDTSTERELMRLAAEALAWLTYIENNR